MNKRVGYGLRPTVYDIRFTGYGWNVRRERKEVSGKRDINSEKGNMNESGTGTKEKKEICIKYK